MSNRHILAMASVAACAALALTLAGALVDPLTAGADTARQAATVTPGAAGGQRAPTAPVTTTLSADPAHDLTSAAIELHAGYIMDPYLLPVVGKGQIAASGIVSGCNGFISATPNVVINWSGKTDQLNIFVYSDGDAVLVIQKPDGSFVCNDDAGRHTVDPLLTFKAPAPGAYKIHVGAAKKDQPALGFLAITQAELDDARLATLDLTPMLRRRERPRVQPLPQLDARSLLTGRQAIFGSTELQAGFKPVQVFAAGGGDISAIKVEDQQMVCAGYLTGTPSYSFTWSGKPQAIRLYFEALKDSSLAVVTPDQRVLCNMNASATNQNPVVDIAAPAAGQYEVYVASMQPDTVVGGKLTITGDVQALPAMLAPGASAPAGN